MRIDESSVMSGGLDGWDEKRAAHPTQHPRVRQARCGATCAAERRATKSVFLSDCRNRRGSRPGATPIGVRGWFLADRDDSDPVCQGSARGAVPGEGLGVLSQELSAMDLLPQLAQSKDLHNFRRALEMKPYAGTITEDLLRGLE